MKVFINEVARTSIKTTWSKRTCSTGKIPVGFIPTFFTDAMIRSIVTHRNNCIQPVLERFLDLLKKSDKHSHVKLVDQIDIEAFIGILYLRSAFRLNLQSRETIWNHESFCFCSNNVKETRADSQKGDKFAWIREPLQTLNIRNVR